MAEDFVPESIREHYEIHQWRHAVPLLATVHPEEWRDIVEVLSTFRIRHSAIVVGGGRKSEVAGWLDSAWESRGWQEKKFETAIVVDDRRMDSPTHKVDCYKAGVALEIEWNNKDPFFDRDLNNFRLLFDLRAIDVGVIVTRCDELQSLFESLGRGASFGNSTTHMSKLIPRVEGGGGGGCPIVVFGMRSSLYDPNS